MISLQRASPKPPDRELLHGFGAPHRRLLAPLGVTAPSPRHHSDQRRPWCRNRLLLSALCDIVNIENTTIAHHLMERRRHLMLGFCVPVPSLSGRSASLSVLPERSAGWFLKPLIWRILLVIKRSVSDVESIFPPALRDGRSKPASLVDEVAQRLAGEKAAAVVEDDLVPSVVEGGAVGRRMRRQQHAGEGPQLVVGGQRLLLEDIEAGAGDLTR